MTDPRSPSVVKTTERYGPCWSCGGSGQVWQQWGGGSTTAPIACQRCGGTGQIVIERVIETEIANG